MERRRGESQVDGAHRTRLSTYAVAIVALIVVSVACSSSGLQGGPRLSVLPTVAATTPEVARQAMPPATVDLPGATPTVAAPAIPTSEAATATAEPAKIRTVFLIMMENTSWSEVKNSVRAPYVNTTLLPRASYAEQYYTPPHLHPSEPNYLWLEAGTNFGVTNDGDPRMNHQNTDQHLVSLLRRAGIPWKAYVEGTSGVACPLASSGSYGAKHNPMVFFDDVTDGLDASSSYCIAHERPLTELPADLVNNTVPPYTFIAPNLCHSMHDTVGCATSDRVRNGDSWLSEQMPLILQSPSYARGGLALIVWDEGTGDSDGPMGLIALSPTGKRGYANTIRYTHSSTLRTLQQIFGVTPLLGDAVNAPDLRDLIPQIPFFNVGSGS